MGDYRRLARGAVMGKYSKVNFLGWDSDDLTNAVELHLWEKFKGEKRPTGYLKVSAKNKLIDIHRKDMRELDQRRWVAPLLPVNSSTDLERELAGKEAVDLLRVALIPEEWRLLELCLKHEFKVNEVWRDVWDYPSYQCLMRGVQKLKKRCREILRAAKIYGAMGQTINKLEV